MKIITIIVVVVVIIIIIIIIIMTFLVVHPWSGSSSTSCKQESHIFSSKLLKSWFSIKDLQGNTAFHYAAANEREDIMGALVGAQDVNLSNMFNSKGYNVIHIASCSGNVK